MSRPSTTPFNAQRTLSTPLGERTIYSLDAVGEPEAIGRLPYSIKVT